MPVRIYTFKVELIGSRNPVISRTFSIPASWTFQRLHAAIQYAFGWQNCHLHHFTFEPARRHPTREERRFISMDYREKLVVIHMGTPEDEDDDWGTSARARFSEKDIKLNDFFEETGKYRQMALKDGAMAKCYYLYDFGVGMHLALMRSMSHLVQGQLGTSDNTDFCGDICVWGQGTESDRSRGLCSARGRWWHIWMG